MSKALSVTENIYVEDVNKRRWSIKKWVMKMGGPTTYNKSIAKFGSGYYYNFSDSFNSYVSITFHLVPMKLI